MSLTHKSWRAGEAIGDQSHFTISMPPVYISFSYRWLLASQAVRYFLWLS